MCTPYPFFNALWMHFCLFSLPCPLLAVSGQLFPLHALLVPRHPLFPHVSPCQSSRTPWGAAAPVGHAWPWVAPWPLLPFLVMSGVMVGHAGLSVARGLIGGGVIVWGEVKVKGWERGGKSYEADMRGEGLRGRAGKKLRVGVRLRSKVQCTESAE